MEGAVAADGRRDRNAGLGEARQIVVHASGGHLHEQVHAVTRGDEVAHGLGAGGLERDGDAAVGEGDRRVAARREELGLGGGVAAHGTLAGLVIAGAHLLLGGAHAAQGVIEAARFRFSISVHTAWPGPLSSRFSMTLLALEPVLVSMVVYAVSFLLTMALSRYRELAADRAGAILIGKPSALASALQKVTGDMARIPNQDLRRVENMNAFFFTPALAKGSVGALFSTHPSTEERIARLMAMARG